MIPYAPDVVLEGTTREVVLEGVRTLVEVVLVPLGVGIDSEVDEEREKEKKSEVEVVVSRNIVGVVISVVCMLAEGTGIEKGRGEPGSSHR